MRQPAAAVALAVLLLAPAVQAQSHPVKSQPESGTARAVAVEACAEGQRLLERRTSADIVAALQRFERAIATDATYAPAFAGLAETRALLYDYLGAKEAAQQALALDDGLAPPHAVLAFARMHQDWDWAGSEAEFRRALELDPGRASTHLWHAILLEVTGRADEAVAEARRAVELAPDQANVRAGLGYRLFWAGRYDEAVKELEAALRMDPGLSTAWYFIGRSRVQQERFPPARLAFDRARGISPKDANLYSAQGYLDARAGKRDAAWKVLKELEHRAAADMPVASQIAALYTALGDKAAALDWLKRSYLAHEGAIVWLKVDPRFESLRGEPGFTEILRKMGFAPSAGESDASSS
ncbi:MAG TPA: tetratricopeptide repeat protein [Thermoanaerobaculia bacterium]|jgi:serine/threonine-protein kinase|nr:tetratricopeptide repeat protein [Thermoanaerobaculia bacterium]